MAEDNNGITEQEASVVERRPATARLEPEVFEFCRQWAKREERSMSNVINIALKRYMQDSEGLKPETCPGKTFATFASERKSAGLPKS